MSIPVLNRHKNMMFVPKNINDRRLTLLQIEAKNVAAFNLVIQPFKDNLQLLQGLQVSKITDQLFIDLLQTVQIVVNVDKFTITLLNAKGLFLFEYNWLYDNFWCERTRVWIYFKGKFNFEADIRNWQKMMRRLIETYFQICPHVATWDDPQLS